MSYYGLPSRRAARPSIAAVESYARVSIGDGHYGLDAASGIFNSAMLGAFMWLAILVPVGYLVR